MRYAACKPPHVAGAVIVGQECDRMSQTRFQQPRQIDPTLQFQGGLRLRVQIFLRWLAVLGQTVAVVFTHVVLGFDLPLAELLVIIGLSVGLNVYLDFNYPVTHVLSRQQTAVYLAYDLAQLALLLYLTGGLLNPFALLMLAPVTISASLLEARTTVLLVVFASLLSTILLVFHEPLPWLGLPPDIPLQYRLGIWTALLLALAFIPAYVWRVSHEGRRLSAALAKTRDVLAREQRLSELDGLAAAAAHQLGTPLSTITLISGELQNLTGLPDDMKEDIALMHEQANRCRDILASLTAQNADDPVLSHMPLHALLDEAVLEIGPHEKQLGISCQANGLLATAEPIVARQPELIYGLGNIIENAVSFAKAQVFVRARYSAQQVTIDVIDDGPGFDADILARLGEPYNSSRLSVPGGNKSGAESVEEGGFGLGLGFFIASTLLRRSGGSISARNMRGQEDVDGSFPKGACVQIRWPRKMLEEPKGLN